MEVIFDTEVNHLGVLIGNHYKYKIIALSTADVFIDKLLIPTFWKKNNESIDSGYQAHLYSSKNDILVLRVPTNENQVCEKVSIAIGQNFEIWRFMTGIYLSSSEDKIVLVSDLTPPNSAYFPQNISWFQGNMHNAVLSLLKQTKFSFLAFTFNSQVVNMLSQYFPIGDEIKNIAKSVTTLMDKNSALKLFQKSTLKCPKTYFFDERSDFPFDLSSVHPSKLYVFKPAGGAAGIGLYNNNGLGANVKQIAEHIYELKGLHQLPKRFQIQEFISGNPYGASAIIKQNGEIEILEIHKQIINQHGKFVGGRWTSDLAAKQRESVKKMFENIVGILPFNYAGLMCLDYINKKVIEVNPRITASAPISHILRLKDYFAKKNGPRYIIKQIDLNTGLDIRFEIIKHGKLRNIIDKILEKHKVICLPQGLNPFGTSRMIFINDNREGTAQKEFIEAIKDS